MIRSEHIDRFRPSFAGLSFATVFLCVSLTPSLLPRTWVSQGLVSGIAAAIGYGTGVVLGWLTRKLVRFRPTPRTISRAWKTLAVLAAALVSLSLYQGARWQREIFRLMGEHPPVRFGYLGVLLLSLLVGTGLVVLVRLLRWTVRALSRLLTRWVPAVAAQLVATVTVVGLLVALLDGVVYDRALQLAVSISDTNNAVISPNLAQPTSPTRSGSPQSLADWSSLGLQGRAFVTGGPTAEQLRRFSGSPPAEPIRVYAGLASAPSLADRATLAVRELVRTGAFSRKVLCVVFTTGTGWVDPRAASSLEYMYNGDSALVGMQYSTLPSWISFAVEREKSTAAARELFNRVYAQWSTLPPGQRPKLLVFGESLGSYGGEGAFSGIEDIRHRVDGALWIGPTHGNRLWSDLVAHRDAGTPQVLPVYQGGTTVRFAGDPADLTAPPGTWSQPRIVYLQHASDPITWWSPDLLVRRPDWLAERPGRDVLDAMRWYPFVTFFQVSADLAFAGKPRTGHGHRFGAETVAAWAAIAPPPGWTARDTARLSGLVDPRG